MPSKVQPEHNRGDILLCADWDDRLVPSVECTCAKCKCKIAVAADNWSTVQARKMITVCLTCSLKLSLTHDVIPGGHMVGGVSYETEAEAEAACRKGMN
jgi:hypothetical protein